MKTITDNEIRAEAEEYGFQVPYDGTNNFNNVTKFDGFEAGAKWYREQMGEQDDWIDCKERLPEDEITDRSTSENVFALCMGKVEVMCRSFPPDGDGGYVWCNCHGDIYGDGEYDDDYGVTHWQPIPKSIRK